MGHGWCHPLLQAGGEKAEGCYDGVKNSALYKNKFRSKQVEKLVGKLRHAAIGILARKALLGLINQLMAVKPTTSV